MGQRIGYRAGSNTRLHVKRQKTVPCAVLCLAALCNVHATVAALRHPLCLGQQAQLPPSCQSAAERLHTHRRSGYS